LNAAAAHFADVGFESFSMAELGRITGVAKGTLYLYFETREEVLLALYLEKLAAWEKRLTAMVDRDASDEAFVAIFYEVAYADSALLALMSRLDSVIEHNVPTSTLIEAKRSMATILNRSAQALAPRLKLSKAQSFDVLSSLGSLLIGTAQIDLGPQIDKSALPDDVTAFMNAFSSDHLFTANARRILAGIRAAT
jgi:AcrR family transcriptional regulator